MTDPGARLLIVDDARANLEALCSLLSAQGYRTMGFTDPREALAALQHERFDLLLTDLVMPGIGGVELLREAQRHDPDIVGIIMTGEGTIASAVESMRSGALDYVLKPLKISVLLPILSRALAIRRLSVENAALERSILERTTELEQALAGLEMETSNRLRAEQALMQAQKLEAIGRLTGGVAHDFNNLLMAIDGALQMLERHIEPDHPARKYVNMGRLAAERGTKVTGQLLAFSRTQKLDLESTDVSAVLSQSASTFAHALGPTISLELDIESDAWARTDAGQLELAIVNLATNARDAMPDGGVATLSVRRTVASDGGVAIAIALRDTGSGMSPETTARALEPFFTTKPRGNGTGLGLAQVYAFAKQCGGEVGIETKLGRGTTVRITLPEAAMPAEDKATEDRPSGEVEPASRGEGVRLLVVDDDDAVRAVMVDGLRFEGFAVSEAESGVRAIEALENARPDAVILDYAMPGMNGDVVAKRARALWPDLPVIFCSGYSESLNLESIDGARILRKPAHLSALKHAVLDLVSSACDA
jgi:signal transduction histidine kinase